MSHVSIDWLPWTGQAFARAAAEQKPILLFVTVTWCHSCRVMETTGFAREDVVALIQERFIPIRVDADNRPDISERYSLGGWPTTALLTPQGEVLAGGTYFAPEALLRLLRQVVQSFDARRTDIETRAAAMVLARADAPAGAEPPHPGLEPLSETLAWLRSRIVDEHDPEHGGFGFGPKYPHVAALRLALEMCSSQGDAELAGIVTRSLDAMGWGGLYDAVDGGFFRYATTRDWLLPHSEKLLEDNAAHLTLYLDAASFLQHRAYRNKAIDVLRYVHGTLADPLDCVFFPSQSADDSYYEGTTPGDRGSLPRPSVDRSIYVDANSVMIKAYLHAADVLGDRTLAEFAVDTLDRLLALTYQPGAGVAHTYNGKPAIRGLLGDQVRASAALLDAYAASDRLPYLMLAEELMRFAIRTMWDRGFVDRAPHAETDLGLLRVPHRPLALNCEAARVLHRLGRLTEQDELRLLGRETLAALSSRYREYDLWGAEFGLAALEIYGTPEQDAGA